MKSYFGQDRAEETALEWHQQGKGVALAWVVETWGSAPRPAGSLLAVSSDGGMAGSVSGGCVEGAVVTRALDAIKDGTPGLLEYGVSDDDAFSVGLACGGRIKILVEPLATGNGPDPSLLEELIRAKSERRSVVYEVNTNTFSRQITETKNYTGYKVSETVISGRSVLDGDLFLATYAPPLRLLVVGAVHIAQSLVLMARILGYETVVIDPREAFASTIRFPETQLLHDWPDTALEALQPDARTAVVTLTHDPKLDDPALHVALRSDAFYIGSLGSKRTHAKRLLRLDESGFTEQQVARIHGPVGADIGAQSPAEIAVSVIAEITECLHRPRVNF